MLNRQDQQGQQPKRLRSGVFLSLPCGLAIFRTRSLLVDFKEYSSIILPGNMHHRFLLILILVLCSELGCLAQDIPIHEVELYRNAVGKQQNLICKMAHPLGAVKSFQPLQPVANQSASEFRYKMLWLGITNKEYETILSFNLSPNGTISKYSVNISANDNSPTRSFEAANLLVVILRKKIEAKIESLLSAKIKMAEDLMAQVEHYDGAKLLGVWLDLAVQHPDPSDLEER